MPHMAFIAPKLHTLLYIYMQTHLDSRNDHAVAPSQASLASHYD